MFCFGTPGASQNLLTKTCFFLNHEPKLLPKLASPIRDKNSQNIAYWYKAYIQRNPTKSKISFSRLQASALDHSKKILRPFEKITFFGPDWPSEAIKKQDANRRNVAVAIVIPTWNRKLGWVDIGEVVLNLGETVKKTKFTPPSPMKATPNIVASKNNGVCPTSASNADQAKTKSYMLNTVLPLVKTHQRVKLL